MLNPFPYLLAHLDHHPVPQDGTRKTQGRTMGIKSYGSWQVLKVVATICCVVLLAALIWPRAKDLDSTTSADDLSQRAAASRKVVKELAGRLKKELVGAMKSGGAPSAIQVCNVVAPTITQDISETFDGNIGRTALKLRNSKNAPDAWERKILEKFTTHVASGVDPKTLEYFEVTNKDGKPVFRYMKAIPTQKPCLACHGPNIDPVVRAKITALYPNDAAVGFTPGSLRGAFTVMQQLD